MDTLRKIVVALTLLSVETVFVRPAMAEAAPKDLAAKGVRPRREGKDQEALVRPSPKSPVTLSSGVYPAEPVASSTSESELPTWRRVLPWSLLAGAVVAGSVAVWQHTVWHRGVDQFVAACTLAASEEGSAARCQDLYDDLSRARTRTLVGYGIAGVLGAGALTFFILNATAKANDDVNPGSLALGIELGPRVTALSLTQHF